MPLLFPNQGSLLGGGGGGGAEIGWVLAKEIDYSVDPGTEWEVTQDSLGRSLDRYDDIYLTEVNPTAGSTNFQVREKGGAYLSSSGDYLHSFRTDNGSEVQGTGTSLILRQLITGGDSVGLGMLYNFGLAAECHGWRSEINPTENNCVSATLVVKSQAQLDAIKITSSTSRSAGKLQVWGRIAGAVVVETGSGTASSFDVSAALGDYDEIRVRIWGGSNSIQAVAQLSNDGGSNFHSTGYKSSVLGRVANTYDGNDNGLIVHGGGNDYCAQLYNFGLADAPTMAHGGGGGNSSNVNWSFYPTEEAHDALRIVFSSSISYNYEIVGVPKARAELIEKIDLSVQNITTTPHQITGLDGYAAIRFVTDTPSAIANIVAQTREMGGSFETGTVYRVGLWSRDGESGTTVSSMYRMKHSINSEAIGLISGFGFAGIATLHGADLGGDATMYEHSALLPGSDAVLDAFQLSTLSGVENAGTIWLVGEKKAA